MRIADDEAVGKPRPSNSRCISAGNETGCGGGDGDADGDVDATDFGQFRARFGNSV